MATGTKSATQPAPKDGTHVLAIIHPRHCKEHGFSVVMG